MPKQITLRFKFYFLLQMLLFVGFFSLSTPAISAWKNIAPGVEYQDLTHTLLTPWSHIHVFRIDLNHNQLELVSAKKLKKSQATVEQFAKAAHANLAINGGFFDQKFQPLGLRVSENKMLNDLKQISWWGIFQIRNHHASIVKYAQFHHDPHVQFAIQSGPRLLIHGKIPPLKPGHADRTALGITKDGHVILLVTDRAPLTTTGLASLMRSDPLSCTDALNLDGGSSSQLFARFKKFEVEARGFSEVSDAIILKEVILGS